MDSKQFYGGSVILDLTSRKLLPLATRVIVVKTGATNGVNLPGVSDMYKIGGPIWYLVNDDSVTLNVYDSDDILIKTIPTGQSALIGFSGLQFDVMVRDKSQSSYFPFTPTPLSVTITENQENFNLRDYVNAETEYDGTVPLTLTVTINAGVIIGGTTPLTTAFDTGTWPSNTTIHLYNNGEILGAGGGIAAHTHPGGGEGGKGGDALKLQMDTILYNVNGRIASGGGQGSVYFYDSDTSSISGTTGCGGGQGYVGGAGGGVWPLYNNIGTNGSPAAPGTTVLNLVSGGISSPDGLFNAQQRSMKNFGNGGWWGCPGEEFCYNESGLIASYGTTTDKNIDGESQSYFSGAPGISILNTQYLTINSIGKITGPSADFASNTYVYYFSEPWATNITVGKTLKKMGWNGTSSANISIYVHPQTIIGHWGHYRPHKKDTFPTPAHGFTVDGHYRVQPNSMLFESDWPSGTTLALENHGKIYGGGGIGALEYPLGNRTPVFEQYLSGPNGGNAITTFYNITIDNQGTIAGGGGGGGCKGREITSTFSLWGYTVPSYNTATSLPHPGGGGSGAGFAYGPRVTNGQHMSSLLDEWQEPLHPCSGQASTLTTGGRAGIGFSREGTGGWLDHDPYGDAGRSFELEEVWDEDLQDYVEQVVDLEKSTLGQNQATEWNDAWNNTPWAISNSWYNTPLATTSTGGGIGQSGGDGGTALSGWFDNGGANRPAGQPGYYVFGNSFVTWTNNGTRLGLVGG